MRQNQNHVFLQMGVQSPSRKSKTFLSGIKAIDKIEISNFLITALSKTN